jgi:hypothetical protein
MESNPNMKGGKNMKDFYAMKNRDAAVDQIMADHAAYIAEQARLSAMRVAGLASIRSATSPEDLAQDELYKAEPWRF